MSPVPLSRHVVRTRNWVRQWLLRHSFVGVQHDLYCTTQRFLSHPPKKSWNRPRNMLNFNVGDYLKRGLCTSSGRFSFSMEISNAFLLGIPFLMRQFDAEPTSFTRGIPFISQECLAFTKSSIHLKDPCTRLIPQFPTHKRRYSSASTRFLDRT